MSKLKTQTKNFEVQSPRTNYLKKATKRTSLMLADERDLERQEVPQISSFLLHFCFVLEDGIITVCPDRTISKHLRSHI